MTTRAPLVRSIPFWGLVVVSLASIGVGGWIVSDRLGVMSVTLTDGTATGIEVYVGQSLALLGSVIIGAGVIGILIALGIAAAASLRPREVAAVEALHWTAETPADEAPTASESPETPAISEDAPTASDETPTADEVPTTSDAEPEPAPTR